MPSSTAGVRRAVLSGAWGWPLKDLQTSCASQLSLQLSAHGASVPSRPTPAVWRLPHPAALTPCGRLPLLLPLNCWSLHLGFSAPELSDGFLNIARIV